MATEANEHQGWKRYRPALAWGCAGVFVLMGVVAATAIPRFVNMANYAKRSEGIRFLKEIHQAQLDHFAKHGAYVAVGPTPQQPPSKRQLPFESEHMDGWKRLGWQPEGMVRCQYEVTVPTPSNFRAVARCDVDGDGNPSVFVGSADQPPTMTTPDDHL